jgi:leukotriene-A4 hydrolase
MAHSWTGNTVTCRDWESFWLNEGFTVFIERHVSGELYGKDFALVEA